IAGGRLGVRRPQARQRHRQFREGAAAYRRAHRHRSQSAGHRALATRDVGRNARRYQPMKRLVTVLTVACVAACAGPRPEIPPSAAVTPPEMWRAETAQGDISATWWQGFGDPVLTKVVEIALANNTDIAIAAERVAEARAQFR